MQTSAVADNEAQYALYLSQCDESPPHTHTHTLKGNSVLTDQTQHKPTPAASHS